jgi:hypothetical protein
MSSEIKTNTISEVTSANGVSIDGLKVKDSALVTDTNKYPYVKSGELNSIGYLNQNFFGASYYLTTSHSIPGDDTWTEIDATWTKMVSSGASGSDDADPFGKFNSGRFTPTISGFYLATYAIHLEASLDDTEHFMSAIRRNGSDTGGHFVGFAKTFSSASSKDPCLTGSGIIGLDTNDYLSLWAAHNEGAPQHCTTHKTTIGFVFLGTSDL